MLLPVASLFRDSWVRTTEIEASLLAAFQNTNRDSDHSG